MALPPISVAIYQSRYTTNFSITHAKYKSVGGKTKVISNIVLTMSSNKLNPDSESAVLEKLTV